MSYSPENRFYSVTTDSRERAELRSDSGVREEGSVEEESGAQGEKAARQPCAVMQVRIPPLPRAGRQRLCAS